MSGTDAIILAAKSSPDEGILSAAEKAGIGAVELYLSDRILEDPAGAVAVCRKFPFRYAVHASTFGLDLGALTDLALGVGARVVVFHDIYWDDEWKRIAEVFMKEGLLACIENSVSIHEPVKHMRRHGMGRCLDLEHLEMECHGFVEEELLTVMRQASHVHMTGYRHGTALQHTHIHASPRRSRYYLDLLLRVGFSGFVVSEARISLQTYREFRRLKAFFDRWKEGVPARSGRPMHPGRV